MVLRAPFPPDVRVANEAQVLVDAGHDVHILCVQDAGRPPVSDERTDSLSVHRIEPLAGASSRANNLIYKLTFVDRHWLETIGAAIGSHGFDVVHVHDLPLVRTALWAAKHRGLPVVFDAHEMWPEKARVWSIGRDTSLWERLSTHSYRRLKLLERRCLRECDHIVCPARFDLDRIAGSGVPLHKLTAVPNYVDASLFDPGRHHTRATGKDDYADRWVILFVGTMGHHRGLHTVVRALPYVAEQVPNATMLVAGRSSQADFLPWLKQVIQETGVEARVVLLGWIDYERIPGLFSCCDVSVVPFCAGVASGFDSIHKIFQSMAMGKPVVATDIADFRQNMEQLRCGIVVPPDDPRALADALVRLQRNPRLARSLGRNGRNAVERHYNWDTAGKRLVELYDRFQSHHGPQAYAAGPGLLSPGNGTAAKVGASPGPSPGAAEGGP
jgi:glycosyltransferase involved in cell wall biosynthesis